MVKPSNPANTVRTATTETARLDVGVWTKAALALLATHGIDGVRVEVLATSLGVTKGSFYWHFKDRDALHAAMLTQWRRQATLELIERLDRGVATPEARLRRLLRLPVIGERSAFAADIELAVRLWGRRDERARAALKEVDELRLHYIAQLLENSGVSGREAQARAVIAYSYMRVAATLVRPGDSALLDLCEDILLGRKPTVRAQPTTG
jgi:AcrR family transcriptional regulator